MKLTATLWSLCAFASSALADVTFLTPAAAGAVTAGVSYTVTWQESNTAPLITGLSSYTLSLFTGSNAAPVNLGALVAAGTPFSAANSVAITIPVALVGAGVSANAVYFLGMTSIATVGGTVINYSGRFVLSGTTGTFSAAAVAGNALVTTTAGPPTVNQVANVAVTTAVAGAATSTAADPIFAIPYNQQTYPDVRYAPMQPIPPTKITAVGTTQLWPTSLVPTATTFLGAPTIMTTYTQAQTWKHSSYANTAAAAAAPSDDMAKFLARWKD